MTVSNAAGTRILALILLATAAAGLAGCSTIDQAVVGGATEEAAQPPANATAQATAEGPAPAGSEAQAPVSNPETAAPGAAAPAPPPVSAAPIAPPPAVAAMAPITIQPGTDTGTTVGRTVANLRSQLQTLAGKVSGDAQQLAELKTSSAQAIATYQQSTANIQTRLAVGTAPGNPELIGQWNTAQGALDTITGNINALSKVAGEIGGNSSSAHSAYDSIQATYRMSGGIDEDQRQLNVLSDEASQTMIVSDRLRREVTQAIQRQTAYVANERGSLTTLASAIRAGDYAGPLMGAPAAAAAMSSAAPAPGGAPIVTIKFDRARVAYEKPLYSALSQALASQPKASFNVVGVAPARDTAAAIRLAENNAQRDAKAVMHTMGDMGVPATRMEVSAATDPAISANEVRVYVK
jgi:uncharacterized protein YgiM (DUF1202 family)